MILFLWLVFAFLTAVVASNHGRNGFGWFFVGLIFGPIGFLIVFIVGTPTKCPCCLEHIQPGATVCPHCHSALYYADPEEA